MEHIKLLHKVACDFLCVPSRPHGKQLNRNYLMGNELYACVSEIPGVTNGDDAGKQLGVTCLKSTHGILAVALFYSCWL